ncbi:MAG: hypothetical protein K6E91_01210 [Butyrivibrio sp.]|nr:hypothetical protein [Butyrivibrio sp.]
MRHIWKYEDVKPYYEDERDYNNQLNDILFSIGKNTTQFFGIMELGDFFLEADPGIAMHDLSITVKTDSDTLSAQKKAFADKIKDVLSTGNLVSCLSGRHYITIKGIKGNVLEYMDSISDDPFAKPGAEITKPSYTTIDDIFKNRKNGDSISLIWLGKRQEPEKIVGEYDEIKYDGKKLYSNDTDKLTCHIMRKKGVMGIKHKNNDMYERIYVAP